MENFRKLVKSYGFRKQCLLYYPWKHGKKEMVIILANFCEKEPIFIDKSDKVDNAKGFVFENKFVDKFYEKIEIKNFLSYKFIDETFFSNFQKKTIKQSV